MLIWLVFLVLDPCSPAACVVLPFVTDTGEIYAVETAAADATTAAAVLVAGPSEAEKAKGIGTAIPEGAGVRAVRVVDGRLQVDLACPGLTGTLPDSQIDTILLQFDWLSRQYDLDAVVLINGAPISSLRVPSPVIAPAPEAPLPKVGAGSLSGKKVTLSPGHGYYWSGSGWYTQRPVYCAPLDQEDFHNIDLAVYLKTYLEQDGATVIMTRETNKNRGNEPISGKPWWQLNAPIWLKDQGYPKAVYSPITSTEPGIGTTNQYDDDRRSRPLASNYRSADLYLSVHTNGYQGDCNIPPATSCPSGTDMYYDSTQNGGFGSQSQNLGNRCQDAIAAAVRNVYDAAWPCRNSCNPRDSNFGEIHYANHPACLLELAFHDTCGYDAVALRDNVFRSAAMWGYYKGVCDFYGLTPGWAIRSNELVSEDIPSILPPGAAKPVNIRLRNRGVVWNEAHMFRLGAVGDSDPFYTASNRLTVSGEVGPTEEYTFSFSLTAPSTPGVYLTDWRMVHDGHAWFGVTISKNITVPQVRNTIAEAKVSADGAAVALVSKIISAKFADHFYVEDSDRVSGMRINATTTAAVGETVDVAGWVQTVDGERQITDAYVSK